MIDKNRVIPAEKLKFAQLNKTIQDEKFDTKPVGYFKDAFRRFKKNKSSVVAMYIIIFLLLFAVFAQIFSPYSTEDVDGYYNKVLPKTDAFAFLGWDGTANELQSQAGYDKYLAMSAEKNINARNADSNPIRKILNTYVGDNGPMYSLNVDSYYSVGFEYVNLNEEEYIALQAYQDAAQIQVIYPMPAYYSATLDADLWYDLSLPELINAYENHYRVRPTESPYSGLASKDENGNLVACYIGTARLNRANYYSSMRLDGEIGENGQGQFTYRVPEIKMNGKVQTDSDGNIVYTVYENFYFQYAVANQTGYKVRVNYYEYYKYLRTEHQYVGTIDLAKTDKTADEFEYCLNNFEFDLSSGFYPQYWFGTNDKGKDIFSLLGSGARLSFILAICVSAINLTIGAIYGAIEGYYGGTLDLVMERIRDILSGVPFIVVATLFSLHLAEKVGPMVSLIFAFVLTGWIGMAGRVRMQFYRFKGQEYVLAARTLGVSNKNIMFKHIFPNALGTIITGSILSIPSVIFTESMLSYLNIIDLETSGFTSVGTMLSNGSTYISTFPHIILFPAIFISLLMISFNLFGNGLRDAFNPSLRGADE